MCSLLTALDGLGQCHTLLRDPIPLQTVSRSSLFPVVSHFYGQATSRAVGYTGIRHQLVASFNGPAHFSVLASNENLASVFNFISSCTDWKETS